MEFQRDEAGVVDTIIFHQPNGHLSGAADLRLISETRAPAVIRSRRWRLKD